MSISIRFPFGNQIVPQGSFFSFAFCFASPFLSRVSRVVAVQNALYIGTENEVIRLGASQRCKRFTTKTQCLNSMDPYCGWQSVLEECTPPPNKNPLVSYWQQSITSCPILNAPGEYLIFFFNVHYSFSSTEEDKYLFF
jgi:Plexin repeat